MKKTAVLFLALTLAISLALPALSAGADYTEYTHPADGYRISYPSDWILVDKETFGEAMELVLESGLPGMDVSAVEPLKEQILATDMMLCMSPDGAINMNMQIQPMPAEVSRQDIIDGLLPMVIEQMKTVFPGMEVVEPGDTVTFGDNEYAYYAFASVMGDTPMLQTQLYYPHGTTIYILTVTLKVELVDDIDAFDAQFEDIASSFVPGV